MRPFLSGTSVYPRPPLKYIMRCLIPAISLAICTTVFASEFTGESLVAESKKMHALLKDDAKVAEFMRTYLYRADFDKAVKAMGSVDKVAGYFIRSKKRDELIKILESLQLPSIQLSAIDKEAKISSSGKRKLTFVFADDKWYMRN